MAESVVLVVIDKLGDQLIQEAKLLKGVKEQVSTLQTELKRMQCYLKDADRRQDEKEIIKNLVSEIRDVAYYAEDLIQTFRCQAELKHMNQGVQRYCKFFSNTLKHHKIGSQIESVRVKVSDLTKQLASYGITAVGGIGSSAALSEVQRELRWSYSHIVEEHVVGIDEDIKELVNELVLDKENGGRVVISVCGMGGLGKTTLAKQVYHRGDVRRHFQGFAWAYVSQQCKKREVWEGILIKLTSPSKEERDQIAKMKDDEVAKKLYEVQQGKKCLVILDDIWTCETWDVLKPGFPIERWGSKLLLTTRNKDVALHVDQSGLLHEPECLNDEQSWELFLKKAFPRRDNRAEFNISKEMVELGKEMVARCAGLPLAITVLGGLLSTKDTTQEWDMIRRSYINANMITTTSIQGHEHEKQYSKLSKVLALSYYELPYWLKPCFLYLSQFPEDTEIPAKKLARLWISEGLVQKIEGVETIENAAEQFLGSLINRCMVQVGVVGSTGRIKTCRMHDLMRDLSLSRAREENFLHIISTLNGSHETSNMFSSRTGNSRTMASSNAKVRRLAVFVDHNVELVPQKDNMNSNLRSLLYFREMKSEEGKDVMKPLLNFKLLRVLDLEGVKGLQGERVDEIGNLILLRFLSLKKTNIQKLSSSMGNLICLETLNLQTIEKLSWESVVQIPNVISRMQGLRHLYLPKWCSNKIDRLDLDNLTNLQTLVNFPASKCDISNLLMLTNLRKLVLNDPECFERFGEIFKPDNRKLEYLQSLSLKTDLLSFPDKIVDVQRLSLGCPRLEKLHIEGRIKLLPEWSHFPPYIMKITLWGSRLVEDPMTTLEKLPNLKVINGWDMFVGKKMSCSKEGFPQLKSLFVRGLHNLEKWEVEEGAMRNLQNLVISDCNRLKTFPEGMKFVAGLKELTVRWMPRAFKRKLEKEGDDFYKVEHVPSIVFLN